jgi:hypothetical protein
MNNIRDRYWKLKVHVNGKEDGLMWYAKKGDLYHADTVIYKGMAHTIQSVRDSEQPDYRYVINLT